MVKLKHIAIIMDGNGRWAKARNVRRSYGHEQGVQNIEHIIDAAAELKIPFLSLFAFSTENWRRPRAEVGALVRLLRRYLAEKIGEIVDKGVRLRISGDLSKYDKDIRTMLDKAVFQSRDNQKITVNIALNYSGRWDIVNAARRLAEEAVCQKIHPAKISESVFSKYLTNADIPDPDLLIRTGNESRISNYYLWQAAYTELVYSKKMWPDFKKADLKRAVAAYAKRDRRFGGVKGV